MDMAIKSSSTIVTINVTTGPRHPHLIHQPPGELLKSSGRQQQRVDMSDEALSACKRETDDPGSSPRRQAATRRLCTINNPATHKQT